MELKLLRLVPEPELEFLKTKQKHFRRDQHTKDRAIARLAKKIMDDEAVQTGISLCDVLWIITVGIDCGKHQWR